MVKIDIENLARTLAKEGKTTLELDELGKISIEAKYGCSLLMQTFNCKFEPSQKLKEEYYKYSREYLKSENK